MNKREARQLLKSAMEEMEESETIDGDKIQSAYLGTFMALDPCGHYHHAISPNGLTNRCVNFWDNLDSIASELGGWIESGEGDPTDIYFCMPIKDDES